MTDSERRRAPRRATDLLVNKFIDGQPHATRLVEISPLGCVLERLLEPAVKRDLYPLEVCVPSRLGGGRMWLWGRPVWESEGRAALRFVGVDPLDRALLSRFSDMLSGNLAVATG
ncbi:MAG: hypothetical protein Q8Q09_28750 [Deltaproteobacteria bacterium]|nr:hypothetical protein [Deltaproteobacteria bacterium]